MRFHPDIRGVLFDFDGTLTLPGALDFPAIKKALGCPLDEPILEYIQHQPADEQDHLWRVLIRYELRAAGASRPNNGAERCLCALKEGGIALGIFTRNSLQSVKRALLEFEYINVDDFAAVITREGSPPKPHPGGVLAATQAMGISPAALMVVGDFRFDIIAGKRAGARTIFLTNGELPRRNEDDSRPDFVCTCFEEILQVLCRDL
ncbi:MAG: HAD family hydrolase [Desulfatiglandaceae bacterium]